MLDRSIDAFAQKANLSPQDVSQILQSESADLLERIVDDALDDGILDSREERKITTYAEGLGVTLNLDASRKRQLSLSKYAYELNHAVAEDISVAAAVALTRGECCVGEHDIEWNEIVSLKRPKGTPLGEGRYLKSHGEGRCHATNKQLIFVPPFESKKARLTSIQQVSIHSDGVFLNRSTGKSLFLRFLSDGIENYRYAMLVSWLVAGVVQAKFLEQAFIRDVVENDTVSASFVDALAFDEPRFTFRVVGDHIGDRGRLISCLSLGDPLQLVREPENRHDPNAVAVLDSREQMLGYLKRSVAEWYGPRMVAGKLGQAEVHRIRDDGALIVGVYE